VCKRLASFFWKIFAERRHEFETRLPPGSLAASHCGFAFCVADPIGSAHESNGNNAVTIPLTQLDEVAVHEPRRVARYVPVNDRRPDSSTRSNADLPPDICALPIASSRRGKSIHLDLSAQCSVKPIRVIRGSLSIGLSEPL
jgi:hypothetical protein